VKPALLPLLLASLAAPLAAETPESRPNILFCIADDWGWPHAGAYGAGDWIKTPTFDRLADEGILFANAFTSNPKCCPCRASILAGRNSWQMKEAVNHFTIWPEEFLTYPDLLAEAGYHVGLTGKGWGPGDYRAAGREHNPAGKAYDEFKIKPPHGSMSSNDYARNFIEGFLAARPSPDTPWCFWLGTQEPHRAYEKGVGIRVGKDPAEVDLPGYYPDRSEIRSDMLDYAVEVEHFDEHVGRVLEHLEKIGELENTVVVMTSDHGMPFPRAKSFVLEHGFHLPLAIRWGAKVEPGRKVNDFVNVRDFAPTFLELAGLERHAQFTGRSLVGLLEAEDSGWVEPHGPREMLIGKERHDLGRPGDAGYPVRAIRTPEFLYIRNYEPDRWPAGNPETGYRATDKSPTEVSLINSFDRWYAMSYGKRPAEELYLVVRDPECLDNLAGKPEFAEMQSGLRARMQQLLEEEGDLRALGEPEWFDTIEYTGSRKHAWDTWIENQHADPE